MIQIKKKVPMVGLALFTLCTTVLAVAVSQSSTDSLGESPIEIQPESEEASDLELQRRSEAIRQPVGKRTPDHVRPTPVIANPAR